MAVPTRTGRSRLTIILLLLTSVTLLTLDFRGFEPLERAQDSVRDAFQPVRDGGDQVFGPVGNAWNSLFRYDDLEAENVALRDELDELRGQAITGRNAEVELRRLSDALDIDYAGRLEPEVAQVVGGRIGNFEDDVVEIDKGKASGIAIGMPVVNKAGLVGRVIDAGANWSHVRLISEPGFLVGVRVLSTDDEDGDAPEIALAESVGDGRTLTIKTGIAPTTTVQVGDKVVTSGIDNSLYPPGVPVGEVVAVRINDASVEQEVEIELSADPEALTFVSVLEFTPGQVLDSNVSLQDAPATTDDPAAGAGDPAPADPAASAPEPATEGG